MYQNGTTDQVIGMVFVGTNKARKDAIVNKILGSIMMALLVVMLLCIVTAMRMAASISKNIKNSVAVVGKLADGDLNVWVDEKLLKRKDEIGDLSRGTMTLRDAMKSVIRDISEMQSSCFQRHRFWVRQQTTPMEQCHRYSRRSAL